jgi:hypothetical protein
VDAWIDALRSYRSVYDLPLLARAWRDAGYSCAEIEQLSASKRWSLFGKARRLPPDVHQRLMTLVWSSS